MSYWVHVLLMVSIYAMLAMSLDLLVGEAGLLSLCHAVFFGVGAYSTAVLTVVYGVGWTLSAVFGVALSILVAILVATVSFRMNGDLFVLATFSVQAVFVAVAQSWTGLTNGPKGIAGIGGLAVLGWLANSPVRQLAVATTLVGGTTAAMVWIVRSPIGRQFRGFREDEVLMLSLGRNPFSFRTILFSLAAVVASLAGSLYAGYLGYIEPHSFSVHESIFIASMVIVGGPGSRGGAATGAALLVLLAEALRWFGIPSTAAASLRQILYGSLLIAIMMWRPRGIFGSQNVETEPGS